jgi:hypothetical protein
VSGAQYIRDRYNVPAWRGGRIVYSGGQVLQGGVIVGFRDGYLRIRLDGEQAVRSYHPTWRIAYHDVRMAPQKAER